MLASRREFHTIEALQQDTTLTASEEPLDSLFTESVDTLRTVASCSSSSSDLQEDEQEQDDFASSLCRHPVACLGRLKTSCFDANLHKRVLPYRVRGSVGNMFDLFQDKKAKDAVRATPEQPKTLVLTEIVGAMNLSMDAHDTIDPYVVVRLGGKTEVHRTKPVQNDGSPIWTIKTKSLCVLAIPEKAEDGDSNFFVFEVCDGFKHLATLTVSFNEILNNMLDQRKEYKLKPAQGIKLKRPILALRFRQGTPQDMVFLGLKEPDETTGKPPSPKNAALATDMNFQEVRIKNFFQSDKKRKDGVEYFRVASGPDPDRPKEETEWMTKEEIYQEALKPSRKWVHAGHGTVGKIYLEILACDNLPRMDLSVNTQDDTDPFVGIAFEDNLVRTDMFWDDPSPRWMPWNMRAFCFHVRHPTSLLMLGVFDYDETPLDTHDPIGRVVINTANFYCDTEYTLRYNLHHDPRQLDESRRGTILIRLRLEWHSEVQAVKAAYLAPPKFIINCPTGKSHQVLRYLTRGAVDMEEPTVDTVKLYANEVVSYWSHYCYFLDVLFETLLWRGRWAKTSIWFPINSFVFSGCLLVSLECPRLCRAMLFYLLGWSLISINYFGSRHPNPWKRVKRSEETNMVMMTGRSIHTAIHIEPDEGVEEGKVVDRVNEIKGQRMSKLITEYMYFMLKVYRIYSKTSVTAKFFSTPNHQWSFLSGRLYYLHMFLKYLCKYTRLYFALINWHGYYANKFTTTLLFLGTLFLLPPVQFGAWWSVRILAWALLGPWMKLVDIYWIHRWYKTSDELFELVGRGEEPEADLPDFEALLESDIFMKMTHSGRIVSEEAIKLKDMREYVFGQFSEVVPAVDSSRYPSVPLPASSARPWIPQEQASIKLDETHVPSQKLRGTMILKQADLTENENVSSSAKPEEQKKND